MDHAPYSDLDAQYHLARLHALRGHVQAMNALVLGYIICGVCVGATAGWMADRWNVAVALLIASLVADLVRGVWTRSIFAHIDADLADLEPLSESNLAVLEREWQSHPLAGPMLERWARRRLVVRQRDARFLARLPESH